MTIKFPMIHSFLHTFFEYLYGSLSTRLLDAGLYEGVLILLQELYTLITSVYRALSEILTSGKPREANNYLKYLIVDDDNDDDDAEFVMCTTIHLECASIVSKNIFPRKILTKLCKLSSKAYQAMPISD